MSALAVSAESKRWLRWPASLLLVAGLIVGAAIALGEPALRRALNGVGGLLWLAAAAMLLWSLRTSPRRAAAGIAAAAAIVVLVWFVRPVDLALSAAGFAAAGAIVAFIGRDRPVAWALAVPAAWLPVHLLMGAARGFIVRQGQVRTDPPPTAAIVPLSMVLAAGIAGLVVAWWLDRRSAELAGRRTTSEG
jgi:hypothetical protein